MTKEENIATLNEHLEHWKRLLSEKICDQSEGEKTIDALQNAINALEREPCEVSQGLVKDSQGFSQQPCDDAISRQATLDAIIKRLGIKNETYLLEAERVIYQQILAMPSVTPQPKMGHWVLIQRGKYIDINCSKCGNTRIEEYAYNYTVDEIDMQEIKDFVITNKMNYCEYCGCKMQGVEE